MSFDLCAYAAEHRYRVRNLHDGAPVPPIRRPRDHHSVAYRGEADRQDAIICRDGYVDFGGYGPDRIGFCVLCRSRRTLRARLRLLAEAGATVTQEADTEAAGYAPLARIAEVLAALRPYRRREALAGARVPRLQSTQTPAVGGGDQPVRIRLTFVAQDRGSVSGIPTSRGDPAPTRTPEGAAESPTEPLCPAGG